MSDGTLLPPTLRAQIVRDLSPVRPLRRPWMRASLLLPIAFLLIWLLPVAYGVRRDAEALGTGLLWGMSVLQVLVGLGLVVLALREAVPGRGLPLLADLALLVSGLGLAVVATFLTWHASTTIVPSHQAWYFWRVCFGSTAVYGLPAFLLAWYLAARAFPLRPVVIGALCGLGGGLLADAGWRTYCHVSEPGHVLSAHLGAVLLLCALGALVGLFRGRQEARHRLS